MRAKQHEHRPHTRETSTGKSDVNLHNRPECKVPQAVGIARVAGWDGQGDC